MDDSFKVRVDRAFGSLEAPGSSSASIPDVLSTSTSPSLWCLTDEEIERKEWIRDKVQDQNPLLPKPPKPYSSFLQGLLHKPDVDLKSDIQELDDDDDEEDDNSEEEENHHKELANSDHRNYDELEVIRSSIGMDCTLDNEEEDDTYDKVAVGREEPADRFYMRSVNDYEVEIDSNNELPNSFRDAFRDPRANRRAAKLRLKEDDESLGSSTDLFHPKSILKPENHTTTESKKQVGFEQSDDLVMGESPGSEIVPLSQGLSTVPDYIRNPSKYTYYTFDSLAEVDEESNRKAYMDFFNLLKGSQAMEKQDVVSTNSSSSVVFTPKKKPSDTVTDENAVKKNRANGREEYKPKKVVPVIISAEDGQDTEVCAMDEDEPELAPHKSSSSSLNKAGRRYRRKGNTEAED